MTYLERLTQHYNLEPHRTQYIMWKLSQIGLSDRADEFFAYWVEALPDLAKVCPAKEGYKWRRQFVHTIVRFLNGSFTVHMGDVIPVAKGSLFIVIDGYNLVPYTNKHSASDAAFISGKTIRWWREKIENNMLLITPEAMRQILERRKRSKWQ